MTSASGRMRLFVTGSTGELGRLVIDELLKRVAPARIVAGVRSPDHEVAKEPLIKPGQTTEPLA